MKIKLGFRKNISGATGIEYGLMGSLISIAIISGVTLAGTDLNNNFSMIGSTFGGEGTESSVASVPTDSGTGGFGFNPSSGGSGSLPFIPQGSGTLLSAANSTASVPYVAPTSLNGGNLGGSASVPSGFGGTGGFGVGSSSQPVMGPVQY